MKFSHIWPLVGLAIALVCGVSKVAAKPDQQQLDNALWAALENNDLKRAQSLLSRGANVNPRDIDGYTALITASFVGDPDDEVLRLHPIAFVQLLLKHGANVNLQADDGTSALMNTAKSSSQAARLLLDKGAHIDAQDKAGATALMHAVMWECEGPCSDPDCVRLLLRRGANPNLATKTGETALIWAAQLAAYDHENALLNAKMLLARGADVNARTSNGNTALKWAKVSGNPAVIRLIEQAQAQR